MGNETDSLLEVRCKENRTKMHASIWLLVQYQADQF